MERVMWYHNFITNWSCREKFILYYSYISYARSAEVRRNSARNVWLVASYETVAKRNFRFSKHTVYDDIKSVCAQPVHKVKADWDERSREPVGNVRLKGCLVHADAARAAVGTDRELPISLSLLSLSIKRKKEKERRENHLFDALGLYPFKR